MAYEFGEKNEDGGVLTSCDDVKMALEIIGCGGAKCQEFTNSTGLANGESIGQHLGIEIARGKEVNLDASGGLWRNVAARVLCCKGGIVFHRPVVAAQDEGGDGN